MLRGIGEDGGPGEEGGPEGEDDGPEEQWATTDDGIQQNRRNMEVLSGGAAPVHARSGRCAAAACGARCCQPGLQRSAGAPGMLEASQLQRQRQQNPPNTPHSCRLCTAASRRPHRRPTTSAARRR